MLPRTMEKHVSVNLVLGQQNIGASPGAAGQQS